MQFNLLPMVSYQMSMAQDL